MVSVKHLEKNSGCGLSGIVTGKIEGRGSSVVFQPIQLNWFYEKENHKVVVDHMTACAYRNLLWGIVLGYVYQVQDKVLTQDIASNYLYDLRQNTAFLWAWIYSRERKKMGGYLNEL